ncbi:Variant-specific surface protein, partial [Giardia duodenalis]
VNDPAGVSIDSFCRPASSPQAITAGCAGSDGAALTDSSTACGMCSGEFFLFMGGCYSQQGTPGSEICTAAEGGKCTACNAGASGKYVIQNGDPSAAPGTECILCSDAAGANGYKGVAGCGTCALEDSSTTATCKTCQAGAFLTGGQCTVCGVDCLVCASATECGTCTAGKYLKADKTCVDAAGCPSGTYADPANGQCKACSTIDANCGTCEYNEAAGKGRCLTCTGEGKALVKTEVDGTTTCVNAAGCATDNQAGSHFLSTDSQKCILCNDKSDTSNQGIEGCGMCKKAAPGQALTCTACIAGYYDSGNGNPATCVACGANCATCTQAGDDKCLTCKSGYFLQGGTSPGTCTPCDDTASGIEGCATCTFSSSLTCNSCKANYKASGTKSNSVTCAKACEDPTACGGTAGACRAIVVGGDGSVKYCCSQCRQ